MTKTETRKLLVAHRQAKISRHRKTGEYRHDTALFLIGYIQSLRDLRSLMEKGSGKAAEVMADLCTHREIAVTQELRKL